jgi:hypothetical protein
MIALNFMGIDLSLYSKEKNRRRIVPLTASAGVVVFSALVGVWAMQRSEKSPPSEPVAAVVNIEENAFESEPEPVPPPEKKFIPGNFTMETIRKKGCVADGLLSEYGDNTKKMIELIERSECQYLHRSLETWLNDPDFEKASEIMARFEKPGLVFGMFIAEAIDKKEGYEDPETGKEYDYDEMCRKNTTNTWGKNTCIPSTEKKEYRKYLKSITQRAMDIGIQSFMFGQIHFQDKEHRDFSDSELPDIVKDMRKYAEEKNLQIIIGAQTNNIKDPEYLALFDYIEGGVGMDENGSIEDGPCWSGMESCWALLWHDDYRTKAKNVLLHLDWSGIQNDDMSKFARMDKKTRAQTLEKFYEKFTVDNMGFLMPMLAPLYPENKGCYGPKKRFYSPDNRYKCQDEDAIKKIMSKN